MSNEGKIEIMIRNASIRDEIKRDPPLMVETLESIIITFENMEGEEITEIVRRREESGGGR